MRNFEVTVTRTDTYTISIDEINLDENVISNYEWVIGELDKNDKIKDLAKRIGFMAMDNHDDKYDGIGTINIDNCLKSDAVVGIHITTDDLEDYDVDIIEK